MKKLLSVLFSFLMISGNAFAVTIKDVPANYWASKEIAGVVKSGIINIYADETFRPEAQVKRAEFNSMLMRTLGQKSGDENIANNFKDLKSTHWAYNDILKSEQIGLIYGYPDKTFRPENLITKSEVASIISHITKNSVKNVDVLKKFIDGNDVESWVRNQYAKTIEIGVYVNHPDEAQLLPNKVLNRAEAAVLLYRLKESLSQVKEEYVAKEVTLGTEHLNVDKDATNNEVTVTNFRRIVLAGNVLRANFEAVYNSRKSEVGDNLNFVFVNDVYTEEGTLLIPRGSSLTSTVATLDPQRIFNQNAEVTVTFHELIFPDGQVMPIMGRIVDNNGVLTAGKLATFGKVAGYTLGGAAIGAGAGVGIAAIPSEKEYGDGVAIGTPVGAGVGLVTGLVTPGLPFKADVDDSLLIELTQDLSIYSTEKN